MINVAVRYFEKRKDPHRKAQAYYCRERVLSDLNASEEVLDVYLKAKEQVEKTMDFDLKARICNHLGSLYWDNRSDRKSLACYKEAYQVYEQIQHIYLSWLMISVNGNRIRPKGIMFQFKNYL